MRFVFVHVFSTICFIFSVYATAEDFVMKNAEPLEETAAIDENVAIKGKDATKALTHINSLEDFLDTYDKKLIPSMCSFFDSQPMDARASEAWENAKMLFAHSCDLSNRKAILATAKQFFLLTMYAASSQETQPPEMLKIHRLLNICVEKISALEKNDEVTVNDMEMLSNVILKYVEDNPDVAHKLVEMASLYSVE
ncbi:uncharacterized protein NEMAJ01_0477 [Nematocida major]|uniref:uncharacterized protein n=1 Tax=Nematocida major TaxID=1912982 RepID=UPI002008E306|nr:uncharacterized protein NEMAJ01_0477 [Nematocida major]KAH9385581.1 hypothetical protein NEMAJ01_0477 [Nematocida major]